MSQFPFATGRLDQLSLVVVACTLLTLALALFLALYTIHLRLANRRKARRWKRQEERWEPQLQKILVGEISPTAAWRHVARRDRKYFVDFLLRFADGLPGADQQMLIRTAAAFLVDVDRQMKKIDVERYARSIRTLGFLGLETFSAEVIAALDDPSPLVNIVAARALLRNGRRDYIEAVLARAHRFEEWSSGFLASMLAAAGPEAGPPLRQILFEVSRPEWLRAAAADALLEQNDVRAGDLAARVLRGPAGRELTAAALRLIKRTGRPEHSAVVRPFCDSSDFAIRAHAVSALASLGDARDREGLRRFFDDPSSWVAIHAARALRENGLEVLRELAASGHPRAKLALQVLWEQAA